MRALRTARRKVVALALTLRDLAAHLYGEWKRLEMPRREAHKFGWLWSLAVAALVLGWLSEIQWQALILALLMGIVYYVKGIALGWFDDERRAYREARDKHRSNLSWDYVRGLRPADPNPNTKTTEELVAEYEAANPPTGHVRAVRPKDRRR